MLPADKLADLTLDYEAIAEAGSMLGSGGVIVIGEGACIVRTVKRLAEFYRHESCGKCIPCREGIRQMLTILNRICDGEGKEGDIVMLEELSEVVQDASLCALGTTAPNPVLSTIRYFKDEYEAHIRERRCPAGVCKTLVSYYINPERCQACQICLRECPVGAITGGKNIVHVIDQDKCTKCGTCLDVCPTRFAAVEKLSGRPVPEAPPKGTKVRRVKKAQQ
jgi:NADH-quinone oxidoreductase subunit F